MYLNPIKLVSIRYGFGEKMEIEVVNDGIGDEGFDMILVDLDSRLHKLEGIKGNQKWLIDCLILLDF